MEPNQLVSQTSAISASRLTAAPGSAASRVSRSNSLGRSGTSVPPIRTRRAVVSSTQVAEARARRCPGGLREGAAPQVGAHPRQQLAEPEGLGQVVVGARLQPDDDVDLVPPGGEDHQHRARLGQPEPAADLDAVEIGQAEVEQDEIEELLGGGVQAALAGLVPGDDVPVALQPGGQGAADRVVVLDDQQFRHTGRVGETNIYPTFPSTLPVAVSRE